MMEELHADPSHQPSTLMYDVSLELRCPQQTVTGLNLWQQERFGRMAVSATSFPWAGPRGYFLSHVPKTTGRGKEVL